MKKMNKSDKAEKNCLAILKSNFSDDDIENYVELVNDQHNDQYWLNNFISDNNEVNETLLLNDFELFLSAIS